MCTLPPPPPPPPASPLSLPSAPIHESSDASHDQLLEKATHCLWASDDPTIRRACIVASICLEQPPFTYTCKSFRPVMQVGPTCGLAALSMLIHEQLSLESILTLATVEGYTRQGEMLSCNDMGKLVGKVLTSSGIENINYSVKNGDLNGPETIECLLNGGALLVPYDADANHAPALKKGHTAHWCLVCGIILTESLEDTLDKTKNIYVLSRHGKSKYLCAWKLSSLAESNNNLWEFSPKKQNDELEYVIPDGGLGGGNGLRGQYVMFEWK